MSDDGSDMQQRRELFEELLSVGGLADTPKIMPGKIDFVLAFVRGDSPEEVSERMGLVSDLVAECGWIEFGMVAGMVVIASGMIVLADRSPLSRQALVGQLHKEFGLNVKIVHGAADGHFGNFGSNRRMSWTFTVPQFDQALAVLGHSAFGEVHEFKP